MYKYIFKILTQFVIIIFLFSNCSGTLGSIQNYKIKASKSEIDTKIISLYSTNPSLEPKGLWKSFADDTLRTLNFLTMRFFYLKSQPEEMIVFSYTEYPKNWETIPNSRIGIIATIRYNPQKKILFFYKVENLTDEEKERVRLRFEKEVLSKLNIEYERDDSY